MIRLFGGDLSDETRLTLADFQAEVNSGSNYSARVELAKSKWDAKENTNVGKTAFRDVKEKLAEMCPGILRCCYCENSEPDEIEHIKPKNLYPEDVFLWENLLYSCGGCNGRKKDKFAVFSIPTGKFQDITRSRNAPVESPVVGSPVFLNLRGDDPHEFLAFEIKTGRLVAARGLGRRKKKRADYTIEVLGLNARSLPERRKGAFGQFLSLLRTYIHHRDAGESEIRLGNRVEGIRQMDHQFVWQQMKRQRNFIPELRELFERAPEALDW